MKRLAEICNAVKVIRDIIKYLHVHSDEVYIVVEGSRDRNVLMKLGIAKDSIIIYNNPDFDKKIIEGRTLGYKSILILVDFDKEGKRLLQIIRHQASAHGYNVLNGIRGTLAKYAHFFGFTVESFFKNYLVYNERCG